MGKHPPATPILIFAFYGLTMLLAGHVISEMAEDTPVYKVQPTPVEITENTSVTNVTNVNNYRYYRYDYTNFQAPHLQNLEYEIHAGELEIPGVDYCGKTHGSSMQVAIWTGNTVCYTEYTGQELEEGQIIRYENNESYTVHAITGDYQQEGYVKTRGYNTFTEETVNLDQVTHVAVTVLYT